MCERTSKGSFGTYLWISYLLYCFRKYWSRAMGFLRVLDLPIGGHCPNRQLPVLQAHIGQARNASEIDQQLGLGQPQLHQRKQTVPASNHFGVRIVEQSDGFLQGLWSRVGELGRKHDDDL